MADKTVITPQHRFKVLTKLFEAGFKSEKDMSIISELQQYTKSNKLYSYLGGMFDEQHNE